MIPKFRAWDKKKKIMNTVDGIHFDGDEVWEISCHGVCWSNVRNYILMQSTGLHDKNGNEIYIDDIVKDKNGYIYRMNMNNYDFVMRHSHLEFEIVGNVYENADILGV
ncbi:YopX family protein [Macrococcus sp. DPC7161]|uniref:YopX family protein n=1 Tax=Macrococcus sp. DPC7161 TaxID=2507060 RepID=UPI00100A5664|nr:YopX family protein [Macrococcus sp. DPC7161]RXK19079.1 hypothetical protein ER639_01835 [Macrococcus sp. DPC7161]